MKKGIGTDCYGSDPCCWAPIPAEIRSLLENRIDLGKKAVGIVVGTIDEKGRAVMGYGKLAKDRDEKPDGDTVFEIGSITKVFTSLILADMVERGEVKLDDPVAEVPARFGDGAEPQRTPDYAAGSFHADLGSPAPAQQHEAGGSGKSIRGL